MIYIPSKWSGHHHEIYRFKGVLRGAGDIGIGRELLYVTGMIATCHGQFGQSKRDIHQPLFMVIMEENPHFSCSFTLNPLPQMCPDNRLASRFYIAISDRRFALLKIFTLNYD